MSPKLTTCTRTLTCRNRNHRQTPEFRRSCWGPPTRKTPCAEIQCTSHQVTRHAHIGSARSGNEIQHTLRRSVAPISIPLTTCISPTHRTSSNFFTRFQKMKIAASPTADSRPPSATDNGRRTTDKKCHCTFRPNPKLAVFPGKCRNPRMFTNSIGYIVYRFQTHCTHAF